MPEPTDRRAYHRQYQKAHQSERTVYMRGYRKRRTQTLRAEIIETLGSRCANCGITDPRVLAIDHRFGNGAAHRRTRGNNALSYYRDVLADLDSFRLLCYNCNWLAYRHGVTS